MFGCLSVAHGFCENAVAVMIVDNDEVSVARKRGDEKFAWLIRVYLASIGVAVHVEAAIAFSGRGCNDRVDVLFCFRGSGYEGKFAGFWFGGLNVGPDLVHMARDGGRGGARYFRMWAAVSSGQVV